MKTIYLKAEVVKQDDTITDIRISSDRDIYYVPNKDLEQAQVLAVEQVLKHTIENPDLEIAFEKGEIFYLTNKENKLTLPELTELVRGKKRTLVEQFEEETKNTAWINSDVYPNGKIHTQEYVKWLEEQLLKNRE